MFDIFAMQLFHEAHQVINQNLIISNPDIISQCRKALRFKEGNKIFVQFTDWDISLRHFCEIKSLRQELICEIIETEQKTRPDSQTKMIVAMPNKQDKLELISQKLTEIGVDEIVFWPADRSVVKVWNQNKEKRLLSIIKEALEQSGWRFMPKIRFDKNPELWIKSDSFVYIFDKNNKNEEKIKFPKGSIIGIIWPEWWLSDKDYKQFQELKTQTIQLGENVLRMETATIVWWRFLKNKKLES